MTNKERYQRTFRTLHASDRMMEVKEMRRTRYIIPRRLVPVAAVLAVVMGLASIAYAADIGGVRRKIQLWIHGDQTNAVMVVENGSYTLTYTDEQGNEIERSGGGVALEAGGRERPLSADELLEELNSPTVEKEEDGTIWVYYQNQSIDITDKFEDGVCRVKLDDGGKTLYMTIKKEKDGNGLGYSTSWHNYPDPRTLD